MNRIETGLERFCEAAPNHLKGLRLGLLCNPASVDHRLCHARFRIDAVMPKQLTAIYAPQHGFFAEKQDNMIESDHRTDALLGLPVFSLYSETRTPTRAMMDGIDALIVDLQDVGTRVYTFIYTIAHCMEAARDCGKQVIVLDRPNPVGGELVEGNCLEEAWQSFVGRYPIPMRHGLTVGELALLFNRAYGIGCDLDIVPMQGWHRSMLYADTGLPWIAPSPNLPTATAALVYPGQVILEGTNVSEGRGTTQPFELFGAPYLEPDKILDAVSQIPLPGVVLRPLEYEPTANKWQGQRCRGFQLHVVSPPAFRPYRTSLALIQAIMRCHSDSFQWKQPPYEYEYERMPIDLILGSNTVRQQLEQMVPVTTMEKQWQDGLDAFEKLRQEVFLYS